MKYIHSIPTFVLIAFCGTLASASAQPDSAAPSPESIKALTRKVADWQIATFDDIYIYKKMAAKLLETQREDGTWSMGMLGDIKDYPNKDTSGTSFFAFGLAWGIREGILDRETYAPATYKAWNALQDCVTEEGMLVWVQPVGAAPGESSPAAAWKTPYDMTEHFAAPMLVDP